MIFEDEVGARHRIFPTPELTADLQEHYAKIACNHTGAEIRRRIVAGGNIQIRKQCLRCGSAIGNAIKRDISHDNIALFNEELGLSYNRKNEEEHSKIFREHFLRQEPRSASHLKKNRIVKSPAIVGLTQSR